KTSFQSFFFLHTENRTVTFRDVAKSYFSQTRVDCIFKVGWLTVNDYYTFAWALAPEGYQTGTDANCSVTFHLNEN
uniref:Calcium binding and coiled-coil domain 1b n=1 Tax=Sinocyclocheilus rhinocerous TaxID=307959 RepID=A0A673L109_9TELE